MLQSPPTGPAEHTRANTGLLAAVERRVLIWLARQLPSAVHSDHLSALGLAAMLATAVSFAAFRWTRWAAAGVLVSLFLNWFGDSLDGTLARVRGHLRPRYGYYVDHVIDLAGTTFLLIGMGCSGVMSPSIAAIFLSAYLLVAAETYLATHARGVFRMAVFGVGPTELRVLLAIGALRTAGQPWVSVWFFGSIRLFDLGGSIAAAALLAIFTAAAIRNTAALYRAEPLPARAGTGRAA